MYENFITGNKGRSIGDTKLTEIVESDSGTVTEEAVTRVEPRVGMMVVMGLTPDPLERFCVWDNVVWKRIWEDHWKGTDVLFYLS